MHSLTRAVVWLLVGLFAGLTSGVATGSSHCNAEWWWGTSAANTRHDDGDGDWEDNHWFFLEGNDYARSLDCGDTEIYGDVGADDIGGGSDPDDVFGDGGGDNVYGGAGNDVLRGGAGTDFLQDDQGSDVDIAHADDDADIIDVRDGDSVDQAYGDGGSNDECRVDHSTEKSGGCER